MINSENTSLEESPVFKRFLDVSERYYEASSYIEIETLKASVNMLEAERKKLIHELVENVEGNLRVKDLTVRAAVERIYAIIKSAKSIERLPKKSRVLGLHNLMQALSTEETKADLAATEFAEQAEALVSAHNAYETDFKK